MLYVMEFVMVVVCYYGFDVNQLCGKYNNNNNNNNNNI